MEIVSKDEMSNRTTDQTQEVIYLDQKGLENLGDDTKRVMAGVSLGFGKFGQWLNKGWQNGKKYTQEKILPDLKNTLHKTHQASKAGFDKIKTKTAPAMQGLVKNYQQRFPNKTNKPEVTANLTASQKESYNIHHYHQSTNAKFAAFGQKLAGFFKKFAKIFVEFFKWLFTPKNRTIIYILLIIVLAGIRYLPLNFRYR
ncbi:MAG: hypothetical protein M1338_03805 [Patescibacteria group bacterium]|nr:hypothetical protein [Patescibacteria group bacterium]